MCLSNSGGWPSDLRMPSEKGIQRWPLRLGLSVIHLTTPTMQRTVCEVMYSVDRSLVAVVYWYSWPRPAAV